MKKAHNPCIQEMRIRKKKKEKKVVCAGEEDVDGQNHQLHGSTYNPVLQEAILR